jgi:hypothetical protein
LVVVIKKIAEKKEDCIITAILLRLSHFFK